MYTGKTKNLGVIGYPIAHSLSPVLQNAALSEAGLDYAYVALPVQPEQLPAAVEGIRALAFRGVNVTIPHKTAIMPLLDEIDEDAQIIGAVNTVVNDDGHLKGYNTDVIGFMDALLEKGFEPEGKTAALLGAGGAARAVIWGLIKHGTSRICIGVRNPAKVQALVEYFRPYARLELFHWTDKKFQQVLLHADLLINTTPLGMYPKVEAAPPVDWQYVPAAAFVYDIIYTPEKTRFLQQAEENGNTILNGEHMLAGQGAAAFQLWTGQKADLGTMTQAIREALRS